MDGAREQSGGPRSSDAAAQSAPARSRVHVATYGCTTNLGDSRTMEGVLAAAGHELVDNESAADIVVLNTCTVIDTTQSRIGHRLRTLQAAGKQVVVAGCMAAAQPELVENLAPGTRTVTPRNLHEVADVVAGRPAAGAYRHKARLPRTMGAADAIIQVSEGCLFSCSYCITKTARGDQTSYPIDELVADVRDVVNAGAVDIRLTSQDTSGYGWGQGVDLPALLRRLVEVGGDFRIRVGMMHPKTAFRTLDDLLDAMDHPKVYKFLHLPIQSGSSRILKAMNRGHTLDEFWRVVEAFRARFPTGVVSTDIITAFPGETNQEHQATLDLVRGLRAEHVNVTRFSPRPGTPAKQLDGRISTQVAKRRSTEVTQVCFDLWRAEKPLAVGREVDAFVIEAGKKPDTLLARGPGYEPIVVAATAAQIPLGSKLRLRIARAELTYFVAVPIRAPVVSPKVAQPKRPVLGTLPMA